MAVWKISSNAALATNDYLGNVRNDKGTVEYGGNIGGTKFRKQDLGQGQVVTGGSVVASGSHVGAANETAYLAGKFGNMTKGAYVIDGITSTLAGQTVTALATPGSDVAGGRETNSSLNVIHSVEVADAMRKGKYNHVTGHFDSGFPVVNNSGEWSISGNANNATETTKIDEVADDGYGADNGTLRLQYGAPLPSGGTYHPRTG